MGIKISELNELTEANDNDMLPIVDVDNGGTKKITKKNFLTHTENDITELTEKIKGTVLYENETGTTENITFTSSIAGYKRMKIEGYTDRVNVVKFCEEKYINIGDNISLSPFSYTGSSYGYFETEILKVTENQITRGAQWEHRLGNSDIISVNEKHIYITKVTGYKY